MASKRINLSSTERAVTTGEEVRLRRAAQSSRLGAPSAAVAAPSRPTTLATDAETWLASYVPQAVTAADWAKVRTPVLAWCELLVTDHGLTVSVLKKYIRALIKLTLHLHGTQPLTLKTVLDPYTINQYAAAQQSTDPSIGDYQSALRFVGRLLNPSAPWETPKPVNTRDVALPYSATEITHLERDITQNESVRARAGEGLLVLGLGAGLDGRWAGKVRKDDVVLLDPSDSRLGLGVVVDGRLVPVLARYEARLCALLAATPDGGLLVGGIAQNKNASSDICDRLELAPGTPRLNCGRLRSTWIVTHLTLGTRVAELAEAAGVAGLTTFSDLLEFVAPLPAADHPSTQQAARQMLRGPQ